ncbi:hypothetical protein PENARI_c056G07626, partial [Penicillium arizonense]
MAAKQVALTAGPLFSTTRPLLQEYVVIIKDRPNTSRAGLPSYGRICPQQTLIGDILGDPKLLSRGGHSSFNAQGTLIACRAESSEAVRQNLQRH